MRDLREAHIGKITSDRSYHLPVLEDGSRNAGEVLIDHRKTVFSPDLRKGIQQIVFRPDLGPIFPRHACQFKEIVEFLGTVLGDYDLCRCGLPCLHLVDYFRLYRMIGLYAVKIYTLVVLYNRQHDIFVDLFAQ